MFAFCGPVAVIPVTRRYLAAAVLTPWVIVCALALRPPSYVVGRTRSSCRHAGQGDDGRLRVGSGRSRARVVLGPGYYMQAGADRREYVRVDIPLLVRRACADPAVGAIGRVSYAIGPDLDILDCTASRTRSRRISSRSPRPGLSHACPATRSRCRRRGSRPDSPRTMLPSTQRTSRPPCSRSSPSWTARRSTRRLREARAALRCPQIARLRHAAENRLTPKQFLSNLWHAYANTCAHPAGSEGGIRRVLRRPAVACGRCRGCARIGGSGARRCTGGRRMEPPRTRPPAGWGRGRARADVRRTPRRAA